MSSGENASRDTRAESEVLDELERRAKSETEKQAEMELLFEVAERRFVEAIAAQQRNTDARFYAFEYVDNERFCVIKLAKSYADMASVGGADADVIDLLVPTLDSNTEDTIIEPLTGNSEGFFFIRRRQPNGHSIAIVKTDRIDRFVEPDDANGSLASDVDSGDRVMTYVDMLNRYDMIPASVVRKADPEDRYRIHS